MESIENHYTKLLGPEAPWAVVDVDLELEARKVEIRLEHPNEERVKCEEMRTDVRYGRPCAGAVEASHTMQYATELVARTPRVSCTACGTKTVAVSVSEKYPGWKVAPTYGE